jgi:mannose/fructose/N-acetylgalactosamine-specific phosphotransferase system component IID
MSAFVDWIKKNLPSDPNSGEARDDEPQSLWGMIDTLVPVLIAAAVYLVIFLIIRRSQTRFYAPRTYLGSIREKYAGPDFGFLSQLFF